MMMNRYRFRAALLLAVCMTQLLWADTGGLAISGRTGTLGFGADLTANVLSDVNCRFGFTWLDLDLDGEVSDVDYDFDLDMLTFPLLVDWYPFDNNFHVSGGIIVNDTDVDLDGQLDGTLTIGDTVYTGAEIGTLSGDLSFNNIAPYIGIGWGNAFGKDKRWGFLSDFGVAFIGSPDVSLSATGTLASDPGFLPDLAREEDEVEDDISDFKIYPVLTLSLFFRF